MIQFNRNNIEEIKSFLGNKFISITIERHITGKAFIKFKSESNKESILNENDYIYKNNKNEFLTISEKNYKISEALK